VGKKEEKLGIRASSTCPVRFDGVKASVADNLSAIDTG
jgi:alkylation response protein AidB-like acyl-CoA dehydrogenase